MLPPELAAALADAGAYFLRLSAVLVPLFVLGSFLVALVEEYLPPERVERVLRRYDGGAGNAVAAGVGAATPFCSCSTVPMLAGLLGAGAPLGLAFSFLLASPLVNELAALLLAGLFGVEVAALYVAVTLASAVALGVVLGRLGLEDHLEPLAAFAPDGRAAATDGGRGVSCCPGGDTAPDCGAGCESDPGNDEPGIGSGTDAGTAAAGEPHAARVRRAAAGTGAFVRDVAPYLLVGVTAGGAIHGFVPERLLVRYLGASNPLAVPLAAVAGAPVYVSMSAMLPVAASLADSGVPVGTVLAFVVGGAGVSVPNLVLLRGLFDRTLLAVYAVAVVTVGIAVGVLFNLVLA